MCRLLQALRKRLEERLRSKEQQMSQMHDSEMRQHGGSSLPEKMKKAALIEKHKLEIEKFRYRTLSNQGTTYII